MDITIPMGSAVAAFSAVACHWFIIDQSDGRGLKTWRLAIPPILGSVAAGALLLLASVAPLCIVTWSTILLAGAAAGAIAGRSMRVQVDRIWGVVQVGWGRDGLLVSMMLVFAALGGASLAILAVEGLGWACAMALAAGLCAGLLDGQYWMLFRRSSKSPHTHLGQS